MNTRPLVSVEISDPYEFSRQGLSRIEQNRWVKNQWPIVYFIENEAAKRPRIGYIGESTNALARIKNHLANNEKATRLKQISIIGSERFNKSATLDIESSLIQYITAEGTYQLLNGNYGLTNHNYYEQDVYRHLFREIWERLQKKKLVHRSLADIENSEVFKYSPYKSLNEDQYRSILDILEGLTTRQSNRIFVEGSAGTGKTIMATYLMKLLLSDVAAEEVTEIENDAIPEVQYVRQFQARYPEAKIGLVIAMKSLRKTLRNVFKKIPGLNPLMVMSPTDTFKLGRKYDLLVVDESHRLRKYKNISWQGVFRENNKRLGLDDSGTELDWILANSKNQLFFYDREQSVRPSDIDENQLLTLLENENTIRLKLHSQMRVQGGNDYISFVRDLLHVTRKNTEKYSIEDYELLVFDSLKDMHHELIIRNSQYGLCRLIAGYSWPWASKKNKQAHDVEIDGLHYQWNQVDEDWINSPNAVHEIGSIHTTMGYDLNYAGVIFGREIRYNSDTDTIEIAPKHYYDINGKKGISDPESLKAYIVNIYKNMMVRGIRGTFVYACDPALRNYLKQHIPTYRRSIPFPTLTASESGRSNRSVRLFDIYAAAGTFSEQQLHESAQWVELPFELSDPDRHFICQVRGSSMNQKIPDGSYCLFRRDEGGTRNGQIVLVQSTDIQDSDFGSGYTIKEYHSEKHIDPVTDAWHHTAITLKPLSHNPAHKPIVLRNDSLTDLKVIGIFEKVLE